MADYQESIPLFDNGDSLTGYAPAAVEGARFLKIAGPASDGLMTVKQHDGTGRCVGISAHSADAGMTVGIHHARTIITTVEAGAALTAGEDVISDANGKAIPATGGAGEIVLGVAFDDAASGSLAFIDRSAV